MRKLSTVATAALPCIMKKNSRMFLWVGMGWLGLQLTSCSFMVEGSFDAAKEKEGGPSAIVHQEDLGANITVEFLWGLSGVGSQPLPIKNDKVDGTGPDGYQPDELLYVASPAKKDGIVIGSALEFVQKGSKTNGVGSRLNYLEGQADALYQHLFSNGDAVFGGLGPYIAYGIGGKTQGTDDFGGMDGYKRFDAGLNLKAGYQMDIGLRFVLGYDLGLYDKSPDPSDFTSRNRSFSVSVGYSVDKIIGAFKRN
jgi:hypothetical protein